jgi:hypothetical protein
MNEYQKTLDEAYSENTKVERLVELMNSHDSQNMIHIYSRENIERLSKEKSG